MKAFILLFTIIILGGSLTAQTRMIITGNVYDSRTKGPLVFATVGVRDGVEETISGADGRFELSLPSGLINDTLIVSYLGYKTFRKKILDLQSVEHVYLEESYVLLDEVVVSHTRLNLREVDKSVRKIRGNLYAMETEVTNAQYSAFLGYLEEYNQHDLLKKCTFDLSGYDQSTQRFFRKYSASSHSKDTIAMKHIGAHEVNDYPAVNISHEGAIQYCKWLTERYNSNMGRKKFKQVSFRLPTLQEWQIGALGYDKFQTWNLGENMVEVILSKDTMETLPRKGVHKTIPVGEDIFYPWYGNYYFRRKPYNHKYCFLGNFKITHVEYPCPARNPGFDGWIMMGRTASYFPNDMGFFDVIGNVAEMIDEKGKACGGSWNDFPSESTIHSVKTYSRPDASIGFRVFMEVLE